jgi:hypothetical protein
VKRTARIVGLIIVTVILASCLLSLISGLTLFIGPEDTVPASLKREFRKGDIISPLEELNFDQGEWTVYVLLSPDDFDVFKEDFSRNCLRLSDRQIMKSLQASLSMTCTGGDAATVSSRLVFVNDGQVVFCSGLLLSREGPEGLQSGFFGWIESQSHGTLLEFCKKFEPLYWPVVIL